MHGSMILFMKINDGHVRHFRWLGPNVWWAWETSQIWIEYIKPIRQMSDEPWKFFGYTGMKPKQSHFPSRKSEFKVNSCNQYAISVLASHHKAIKLCVNWLSNGTIVSSLRQATGPEKRVVCSGVCLGFFNPRVHCHVHAQWHFSSSGRDLSIHRRIADVCFELHFRVTPGQFRSAAVG